MTPEGICLYHVTRGAQPSDAHGFRSLHVSLSVRRNGRSCEEESPWPALSSVGKASDTMAGQAFDSVQARVHPAGGVTALGVGNWHQCMGHTESSV